MRRAVPLLLLAGAAACAVVGLTRQAGAALGAGGTNVVAPATPLVSARRVPGVLAGLVADQKLASRLSVVTRDRSTSGNESCLEVRVAGVAVYGQDASRPLLPASNVKLLTAYAALSRIGLDAHFTTTVVAAKAPANGVIEGPLVLVGGGDPLLATSDYRPSQTEWTLSREPVTKLEDLADKIKAAGVTHITGGVEGDDTRYDSQRTIPTWKPSYLSTGEIGPVGALEVNGGFTINGRRKSPDANPAASAAAIFAGLLQSRGITIEGAPGAAAAPPGAVAIASVDSLPLRDVVGVMLRESDNLAAEMLVKELGHRFGSTGSWAEGLRVVRDSLTMAKVPLGGVALVDGSGLDRSDRAPCDTLAALVAKSGPVGEAIMAGLPRAGICGTLAKRFLGQPAAGRIQAKTGSLDGVASLTGYVDPAPLAGAPPVAALQCPPGATPPPSPAGERVTFSLLVNGLAPGSAGLSTEDRVADTLVSYPELPPLEEFAP